MASKYCPKCGRVNSTNGIPNFCMWGCGSLADEPVLPDYNKMEEREKMIQQIKENHKNHLKTEEIEPGAFQIKLL